MFRDSFDEGRRNATAGVPSSERKDRPRCGVRRGVRTGFTGVPPPLAMRPWVRGSEENNDRRTDVDAHTKKKRVEDDCQREFVGRQRIALLMVYWRRMPIVPWV